MRRQVGTLSLLAGIALESGEIVGLVRPRHRSAEFVEFLATLDPKYPADVKIQVVLIYLSGIGKRTIIYIDGHMKIGQHPASQYV